MSQAAQDLRRWALLAVAFVVAVIAVVMLERPRAGLEITRFEIGSTPATLYRQPQASGPLVVIAHGFAGSQQLMQAWALGVAQAGYTALSFDFEGHGRNPVPMSGDVEAEDGTTQLLMAETQKVIRAGLAAQEGAEPAAVLGHSMATDILARVVAETPRVGPMVGISMFSREVSPQTPAALLMVTGQWEPGLRAFARDAVAMVQPGLGEGETATDGVVIRRAIVAPFAEHVSVLYSRDAVAEAVAWLDAYYGRTSDAQPMTTGPWLLLLLAALVAMTAPLAKLLPSKAITREPLETRQFAVLVLAPALVAPLSAIWIDIETLPVLVADYLMAHLLIYGVVQAALLAWFRVPLGRFSILAAGALMLWSLGVFGVALDRYGASFVPHAGRWPIIALLCLGAVPFMAADALTTRAGRESLLRRLAARGAFLGSLILAVALDFERLFFLIMIAPVIVLFFLVFGLMGRWVGRRSGALSAGVALGVVLAWALGVSFPLFQA